MSHGSGVVSNRRNNVDTNVDAEALERENDRELEELSSKASYLKQITTGIRNDVEAQNLLLNNVDDRMSTVQSGLAGVVGKFKKTLETPEGKRKLTIIGIITIVLLIIFYAVMR
eukprot:g697.t1